MSKLLTNTLFYTLSSQISRISSLVALPLITPFLTDVDYGIWGVIMAYVGLTQAFSFLGLYVALTNSYYRNPNSYVRVWRHLYGFLSLWMPIFGVLNALLIYLIVPLDDKSIALKIAILITLPMVLFGPVSKLGEIKYQLEQNAKPIAVRASILGIFGVCLNIFFIKYLGLGYMGWVWSNFIVTVLMNATYFYPLVIKSGLRPIYKFNFKIIKSALLIGIPTIPHKYANYLLSSSDKIVLDNLNISAASIGGYNLASSFGGYFEQLTNGLERALSPRIFGQLKEGRSNPVEVLLSFKLLLLFAFLYGIWSKEIFHFLIRNIDLQAYYKLSIIMVFAYTYRPFYTAFSSKVLYNEKTKYLWIFSLTIGLINVITNIILVPIYDFKVVAYTTLGCYILLGFLGNWFSYFGTYDMFPKTLILKSIIAILLLLFLSFNIVDMSPLIKMTITIFVVLILCYSFYAKFKK